MNNKDKSEKERAQLTQAIIEVERREDDFDRLKERFEQSLENFYADFQYLASQEELLLQENAGSQNRKDWEDWESHQTLLHKVNRYVNECYTEISNITKEFKRSSDDKREQLIKERNQLLWE